MIPIWVLAAIANEVKPQLPLGCFHACVSLPGGHTMAGMHSFLQTCGFGFGPLPVFVDANDAEPNMAKNNKLASAAANNLDMA